MLLATLLQTDAEVLDLRWSCSTVGRAGRRRGKHSVYSTMGNLSGSGIGPDLFWPIVLWCLYSLLRWLPSIQLVEAGRLTSGWPYARPTTLYQIDHATFISLAEGAGTFWYSRVEVIDTSLCTVAIYCIVKRLIQGYYKPFGSCFLWPWTLIKTKLYKVLMYYKEVKALIIPPGHGVEMTYCESIMSKYFLKCTFSFEGNILLNL